MSHISILYIDNDAIWQTWPPGKNTDGYEKSLYVGIIMQFKSRTVNAGPLQGLTLNIT